MKKYFIFILGLVVVFFLVTELNKDHMKKIKIGDKVPSFSLEDQNAKLINVNSSVGKPMVIYFYPKDDTPGCVKEACAFRDEFEEFLRLGVMVIGISGDSVESHKKFEEKYSLPFTLLADIDNEVRKLFGVPKSLFFLPGRVTYVVDKKGIVQYVFNSQFGAEKHIKNALNKLNDF